MLLAHHDDWCRKRSIIEIKGTIASRSSTPSDVRGAPPGLELNLISGVFDESRPFDESVEESLGGDAQTTPV